MSKSSVTVNVMNPENIQAGDYVFRVDRDFNKLSGAPLLVEYVSGTYGNKVYIKDIGHELYAQCFVKADNRLGLSLTVIADDIEASLTRMLVKVKSQRSDLCGLAECLLTAKSSADLRELCHETEADPNGDPLACMIYNAAYNQACDNGN